MSLVTEFFTASLADRLGPDGAALPLSDAARADLFRLLADKDAHTYLTIRSDAVIETVRAHVKGGVIVLDRGLEGTEPVTHHVGACVSSVSPTVIAAIKDLVCNHQCCDDGCPTIAVARANTILPNGVVGVAYEGIVSFSGTWPINISVSGAADWMRIERQGTSLHITGTPPDPGTFSFSVAASNGNGANLLSDTLAVTVKEWTP